LHICWSLSKPYLTLTLTLTLILSFFSNPRNGDWKDEGVQGSGENSYVGPFEEGLVLGLRLGLGSDERILYRLHLTLILNLTINLTLNKNLNLDLTLTSNDRGKDRGGDDDLDMPGDDRVRVRVRLG
jgi:hypothetical protein